jgi:hypothetical protein
MPPVVATFVFQYDKLDDFTDRLYLTLNGKLRQCLHVDNASLTDEELGVFIN